MANKRVHEIAKEQNLSSKEVLEALVAAGYEVTAAASSIDEDVALRVLKGEAPSAAKAASPGKPAAPKAAPRPKAPVPQETPAEPDQRVFEPDAPAPATPSGKGAGREPSLPPAPRPTGAERAKAGPPPPKPRSEQPPQPPPAKAKTKEEKPEEVKTPPPGQGEQLGPKIIAQPEKPKRQEGPKPGALPGGKRRVVIDSQASRRPGGPPPPGGFPQRRPRRRGRRRLDDTPLEPLDTSAQSATDVIRVNSGSTVKDVAEYLGVPVPDVIKELMGMGEMATLTQTLSDEAILVLAETFKKEVEIVSAAEEAAEEIVFDDSEAELVERPPVITVMGHVDHGKTSLLDAIRETEVVAGEAGGITQHIGAYQVHHDGHSITFLDTPGHQAFTAMRARGAQVTDVAVIVVAADDGPKPQTDEAIDHARAAGVPIVVAVNKIDKEGADPTRVRTELTERKLQPAEWGGDTEYVDVSARSGEGIDSLLETLLVVAELADLKANPDARASGVIVESRLDPGRGPVVTVLVQRGTMRVGDPLVAGAHWGKVRAMHD